MYGMQSVFGDSDGGVEGAVGFAVQRSWQHNSPHSHEEELPAQ